MEITGHNGAGKTTTIACCVGMLEPTSGSVIVNGYDLQANREEVRRQIGICLQHNLLFDEMNVEEHWVYFARVNFRFYVKHLHYKTKSASSR